MNDETDEEEMNGSCLLSCVSSHLNTTSPVVNADLLEGITVTLQGALYCNPARPLQESLRGGRGCKPCTVWANFDAPPSPPA